MYCNGRSFQVFFRRLLFFPIVIFFNFYNFRIDIGGKALTNQLKDWISYKQLNVAEETYLINCVRLKKYINFFKCKEDVCFVSTDFQEDLRNWRAKKLEYLLPDFTTLMKGEVC
jgi:actin-related protein 6